MSYEHIIKNIVFQSEGTNCAAWLYVPDTPTPPLSLSWRMDWVALER